ncbi:ATP-dependent DNA ligase [Flavihumibacter sp. UBA7668]|uniref:ATP-dependent DNA ligase n=1 Tax=Flavihumibacter sp. UBA7668 TaxID=1946542 RepID=UPI0025B9ADD0|nr:ATP-dependent DNA ligase [Flavihumibacter sp. UBA7668]
MEPLKQKNKTGMNLFADLVQILGTSTKIGDKLSALIQYFETAPEKDAVWVIALFTGRRPKRTVGSALLRTWSAELVQLPSWLFEEAYHTVGDLAETISLLLPPPSHTGNHSLQHYLEQLITIGNQSPEEKKVFVLTAWQELDKAERFVFNKLITGGFRIGISQQLLVQSLSRLTGLEASQVAYLISGQWDPQSTGFNELFDPVRAAVDFSKPYPFYLSYALETDLAELGNPADWQAEWKWDGIRGQLIKRNQQLFVWSRGEELMTDKFPEYASLLNELPDGLVLDGEIIPAQDGRPLPFALLQTRIGRKNITRKQLQDAPVCFFAYDLLEWQGTDWRNEPLTKRRAQLETLLSTIRHPALFLPQTLAFASWVELTELYHQARDFFAEGLMIKRNNSLYQVGRKRGDWWKWKTDPLTIDAVLIYAQKGHGRRSNLYTDYTFAVRKGDEFITFTKAYSGLTDKELAEVDAYVKKHGLEKFGPVRTVKPELVFEIAFEGIAASNRHKSGVALRFPRISRWRKDKTAAEVNTLEDLQQLLQQFGTGGRD